MSESNIPDNIILRTKKKRGLTSEFIAVTSPYVHKLPSIIQMFRDMLSYMPTVTQRVAQRGWRQTARRGQRSLGSGSLCRPEGWWFTGERLVIWLPPASLGAPVSGVNGGSHIKGTFDHGPVCTRNETLLHKYWPTFELRENCWDRGKGKKKNRVVVSRSTYMLLVLRSLWTCMKVITSQTRSDP